MPADLLAPSSWSAGNIWCEGVGRLASDLPAIRPGARIGLLGGSFDPAHEGHVAISKRALRQARLDRVWWLVSPQNPLKENKPSASLPERLAQARHLAGHPHHGIWVSDIEAYLKTRYTVDSVRALRCLLPDARFVLLMGSDNLAQLPQWHKWRDLIEMLPFMVAPRGAGSLESLGGAAKSHFRGRIISRECSRSFLDVAPPALFYLSGPRIPLSSTGLRKQSKRVVRRGES